jgi:tRNA(Ile)-lysidine synthase
LTTSSIHQQVRRTIRRHALCPPGTRVLVGLSGGSDSVALTWLLRDLSEYGGFTLCGAAHLNHQLRSTAARDVAFCRELAGRLALPLIVEAIDVGAYAAAQRLSIEEAARRVRYDFLRRAAAELGANRIAVGHTEDDQAETFLMKLMRGAGHAGLGGIYPQRNGIIRPLLDVSRTALQRHLVDRGETWIDDETNADLDNPRNRVRHRVLPELDRSFGAPTRPAIARAAALIREDGQWLDVIGTRRFGELASRTADGLEIDGDRLAVEPPPVRRRVLLQALRAMAGEREVGLEHVDAADGVLSGTAAAADVPGGRVELRPGKLVLLEQGKHPK